MFNKIKKKLSKKNIGSSAEPPELEGFEPYHEASTNASTNTSTNTRRGSYQVADLETDLEDGGEHQETNWQDTLPEPPKMKELMDLSLQDLEELRVVEPAITEWLKKALTQCHNDAKLKQHVSNLLGTFFYTGNFTFLGSWNPLKEFCNQQALELGADMKKVYEEEGHRQTLGEQFPNVFAKVRYSLQRESFHAIPCKKKEASRRQDDCIAHSFPRDARMSQLWNEKCYIHFIRMVAMGINERYLDAIAKVAKTADGVFKPCTIKGYGRMTNKCTSKLDHYYEAFPRPSLNIDINRSATTFDRPDQVVTFMEEMCRHPEFGGDPVRLKNMFLYDDEEAAQQFHYRTVMCNWLYTPGITYRELVADSEKLWNTFYDYNFDEPVEDQKKANPDGPLRVRGFGNMDTGENWSSWREQIKVARAFLESTQLQDEPVQFIVETQLLLRPYLEGRKKMHFLYKVCRAENDEALYKDFAVQAAPDARSYKEMEDDASAEVSTLLENPDWDPNTEYDGDTKLWQACYWGYDKNVKLLLGHKGIDINLPRQQDGTTCLYMAADKGHDAIVRMLMLRPELDINAGSMGTDFTALFAAADNGRERTVQMLLEHPKIDVNKPRSDLGFTPLYMAAQTGNERVVETLVDHKDIDVNKPDLHYGATPLTIAATNGHEGVVKYLLAHPKINVNTARTDDGNTPLLMSASYGHAKVTEMLCAHPNIDINQVSAIDGSSPIYMAAALGFSSVVEVLVHMPGIKVNLGRSADTTTALYWARQLKNEASIRLLEAHKDALADNAGL